MMTDLFSEPTNPYQIVRVRGTLLWSRPGACIFSHGTNPTNMPPGRLFWWDRDMFKFKSEKKTAAGQVGIASMRRDLAEERGFKHHNIEEVDA